MPVLSNMTCGRGVYLLVYLLLVSTQSDLSTTTSTTGGAIECALNCTAHPSCEWMLVRFSVVRGTVDCVIGQIQMSGKIKEYLRITAIYSIGSRKWKGEPITAKWRITSFSRFSGEKKILQELSKKKGGQHQLAKVVTTRKTHENFDKTTQEPTTKKGRQNRLVQTGNAGANDEKTPGTSSRPRTLPGSHTLTERLQQWVVGVERGPDIGEYEDGRPSNTANTMKDNTRKRIRMRGMCSCDLRGFGPVEENEDEKLFSYSHHGKGNRISLFNPKEKRLVRLPMVYEDDVLSIDVDIQECLFYTVSGYGLRSYGSECFDRSHRIDIVKQRLDAMYDARRHIFFTIVNKRNKSKLFYAHMNSNWKKKWLKSFAGRIEIRCCDILPKEQTMAICRWSSETKYVLNIYDYINLTKMTLTEQVTISSETKLRVRLTGKSSLLFVRDNVALLTYNVYERIPTKIAKCDKSYAFEFGKWRNMYFLICQDSSVYKVMMYDAAGSLVWTTTANSAIHLFTG